MGGRIVRAFLDAQYEDVVNKRMIHWLGQI